MDQDIRVGDNFHHEEYSEHRKSWKPFLRQLYVCTVCSSLYFVLGLCFGAPTVYVPQMRKEANSISEPLTDDMASCIRFGLLLNTMGSHSANRHSVHRKKDTVLNSNSGDTNQLHSFLLQYESDASFD
nr:uncharacterized protein LOC126053906 [Helicoverpa armigera]